MINFFHKIRQGLLIENKIGKYLKYAIGEVILVMVGILLALQVNNWSESKKKEKKEIALYHQIIDDLNSEYPIIELRIRELKSIQNLHFQLYYETQGKAEYDPTTYYNALFWVQHYEMFFNDKYHESLSFITEDQIHERLKKYIKQEKKNQHCFLRVE